MYMYEASNMYMLYVDSIFFYFDTYTGNMQ